MGLASNIKSLRTDRDWTQEQLAEKVGVTRSTVTQWETGWSQPRMGAIEKLASIFGTSVSDIVADVLIPSNARPVYSSGEATVPLYALGHVHAGGLTDEEEAEVRVEVPLSVHTRHPRAFALIVDGDCMNKVIPSGSHVLVDPDKQPQNGSIAIVETEDYQAVMRRWYKGSSTLMLAADSFEPQDDLVFDNDDDGSIRLIGTVVWFQSADEME